MQEPLKYNGFWFLPDNPNERYAGVLTYIPHESISLELFGDFNIDKRDITKLFNRKGRPIIQGETEDAKKITLIDCIPGRYSIHSNASFFMSSYESQYILIGKWINQRDSRHFRSANIIIDTLSTWCYPAALRTRCPIKNNILSDIEIKVKTKGITKPIISTKVDSHTNIELHKNVIFNSGNFFLQPVIKQFTYLKISKNIKSNIFDLMSDILLFKSFLILASLKVITIDEISLSDQPNTKKSNTDVETYKLIYVDKSKREDKENDYLFNYNQIKEIFPMIIKKWYDKTNTDIIPIRKNFINSLESNTTFDSKQFNILAHTLEGYYLRFISRKKKDKTGLNKICNIIYERYSSIDLIRQFTIDSRAITESRNYYSHYFRKDGRKILYGVELLKAYQCLRVLLLCCILEYIGIDNTSINQFFKSCSSKILYVIN